jgi:hypothetical protein
VSSLYVVGGRQRVLRTMRDGSRPWQGYDQGLVLKVDPATGEVSTALAYSGAFGGNGAASNGDREHTVSFQASQIDGERLYTCTETEAMVYRLPGFELVEHVSLPVFNDVHHARPSIDGHLLVANAGLEMVLEVDSAGEILQAWNVLGEDPWSNLEPELDYRWVSTKPHRSHPNFVFYIDGELWATRFHQGDAVSLTRPGERIHISSERIHDGIVYEGHVYFTAVNGRVVVVDTDRLEAAETFDLTAMHEHRSLLGWCRGLLLDGSRLWVGFSRIRATKFRENVGWVSRGFRRDNPTRIACYDLERRECIAEIDLEPAGLAAVYSILPGP